MDGQGELEFIEQQLELRLGLRVACEGEFPPIGSYLRLTETLATFIARLRTSAQTLDIVEPQRIVRLLVKEVLVGDDTIIIHHSIFVPTVPTGNDASPALGQPPTADSASYLLRKERKRLVMRLAQGTSEGRQPRRHRRPFLA